jgi:hypothetical protein
MPYGKRIWEGYGKGGGKDSRRDEMIAGVWCEGLPVEIL